MEENSDFVVNFLTSDAVGLLVTESKASLLDRRTYVVSKDDSGRICSWDDRRSMMRLNNLSCSLDAEGGGSDGWRWRLRSGDGLIPAPFL